MRKAGLALAMAVAAALAGCGGAGVKAGAAAGAAAPAKAVTAPSNATAQEELPPLQRDPSKALTALVSTEKGDIRFVLMEAKAPVTVENFVKLARKGFYANLAFHRVEPGLLIQGGDPKGDGTGGPGYAIKGEFNSLPFISSAIGMARTADPDSAGSQFFICIRNLPSLNNQYALFGYVIEGMDVVSSIQKGDRMREVRIEEVAKDRIPASVPK